MKRFIAITALLVAGFAAPAAAQGTVSTSAQNKPLADVAKDEEARRKTVSKPAKVYTNSNLRTDISVGVPLPPSTPRNTLIPGNTSPGNNSPGAPGAATPPMDQAYWADRIKTARTALDRNQMFADALQSRINALRTDFVNRDDPARKAKIEGDLNTALAELARVTKEMEDQRKGITAIEDDARRAGVPPGWLRPGA
ncbi:MAG TPA: hypothetical protein VK524_19130 [Polyangiaceae bacterium]|nr:hypothetical protein [Polyangiaceae bacterium]